MAGLLFETFRLTVWLALLAAIFVPLERLFSVAPQKLFRRQALVDLGYYFVNGLALSLALAVPAAAMAALAQRVMPEALLRFTADLPLWQRVIAGLVIGDFGAYWGHRWSHEIPLLWRFHAIHHSAEEVDWLTNTRAHPVDLVITRICGLAPLFAVGLAQSARPDDPLPAMVAVIGTIWSFFIHANVKWRLGWLEQVISTPAFHRWHHTNDAMRDRNYAAILPGLDRLFGTYHLPPTWPTEYGIDAPMPTSLSGQLLSPFDRPR
jgi:sterol desaturase/sphingolipid hydroxylase (fatty acid hydroxylase superfamily)